MKEKSKKGIDKMKNLKKTMQEYMMIETVKDLKKNKLTLAEHDELHRVLLDVNKRGQGETIMEGVRDWMIKHGAEVETYGIGWAIK